MWDTHLWNCIIPHLFTHITSDLSGIVDKGTGCIRDQLHSVVYCKNIADFSQ